MVTRLKLIVLAAVFFAFAAPCAAGLSPLERSALSDLISSIPELQSRLLWNDLPAVDPCEASWDGLLCDFAKSTVVGIRVSYRFVTNGTLPDVFNRLGNITEFTMVGLGLTGPIPPSLGSHTSLKTVNLRENDLSGPIPNTIAHSRSITKLLLYSNRLVGPLPSWTTEAAVTELELAENLLFGANVTTLFLPPNISSIVISNNPWNITLAQLIGGSSASRLQKLAIDVADLFGDIPVIDSSRFPVLSELSLRVNRLSGSLNGLVLPLSKLVLDNNLFNATLPVSTTFWLSITDIDISYNQFTGEIPGNVSAPFLTSFSASANRLTGTVPEWLWQSPTLRKLAVNGNVALGGSISPVIEQAVSLEQIYLSSCNFSGSVPDAIGRLGNLTDLFLGSNRLNSTLPPLTGLSKLRELLIHQTDITGPLPETLWSLPSLRVLDTSGTPINQTLPSLIGGLKRLERLVMPQSRLAGPIPAEFYSLQSLRSVDLSNNALNGTISSAISNMTSMADFRVATNSLEGSVPLSLSYGVPTLVGFDISRNSLSGCVAPPPKEPRYCAALANIGLCGCTGADCGLPQCLVAECLAPRPSVDSFCRDGVWVIPRDILVVDVIPGGGAIVVGSLVINTTGTVTLAAGNNTALTVLGCATFSGTLNVSLSSQVISSNQSGSGQLSLVSFEGFCGGVQTRFSSLEISSTACQSLNGGRLSYTDRSLSLLFDSVSNGGCAPSGSARAVEGMSAQTIGIIVGCTIGGVALIAIIVIVLALTVPAVGQKLMPWRARRTATTRAELE